MSCEEARKRVIEAHSAYHAKADQLNGLLLSWVGSVVFDDDEFEDLSKQQDELYDRFRAAEAAFFEAKRRHRD